MNSPAMSLEQVLNQAHACCDKAGFKFTKLREQVLSIIVSAGRPIGAYDIMSELEAQSNREQVAPPTVYRTLDFLLARKLVNRVHTLNAYLPKQSANPNSLAALFICRHCGFNAEAPNNTVQQSLNLAANKLKFQIENQALEVLGCCANCSKDKLDEQ